MKKGQIVEGIVKEIQFPNKGMVEVEGEERKVIVKNVLPGQKVKASVNKIRKGKEKDVSWKSWRSHRKNDLKCMSTFSGLWWMYLPESSI